jgi:hypothetical protein
MGFVKYGEINESRKLFDNMPKELQLPEILWLVDMLGMGTLMEALELFNKNARGKG